MKKRLISFLLAISVLASGCGKENVKPVDKGTFVDQATANSMKAVNFKGDAKINNQEMDPDECPYNLIAENELKTADESYVRVDLGATKHLTMDVNSLAKVSQEKKHYKIQLEEGEVFFVTTEPLSQDEEMEFVDSIAQFAIHGTLGCFRKVNEHESIIIILEGEVQGTVGSNNTPFTVKTGELADLTVDDHGDEHVTIRPIVDSDIDMYMKNEIGQSVEFSEKLIAGGGTPIDEYEKPLSEEEQKEIYEAVLEAYVETVDTGNVSELLKGTTSGNEQETLEEYLGRMSSSGTLSADAVLYYYRDLNNDGTQELLILSGGQAASSGSDHGDRYDIWTIRDGKAVRASGLDKVTYLSFHEDGRIMTHGNSLDSAICNVSSSLDLIEIERYQEKVLGGNQFEYYKGIDKHSITGEEYISAREGFVDDMSGRFDYQHLNQFKMGMLSSGENAWKGIFENYIRNSNVDLREYVGYELAKIDNDETPELILIPNYHGGAVLILSIDENGQVIKNTVSGTEDVTYEEKSGKIVSTYFSTGDETVYFGTMKDHRFSDAAIGEMLYFEERYTWESKDVSVDEYNRNKRNLLGSSQKKIEGYDTHVNNIAGLMNALLN